MQFKINTPEFEKWKFVFKAINSIIAKSQKPAI